MEKLYILIIRDTGEYGIYKRLNTPNGIKFITGSVKCFGLDKVKNENYFLYIKFYVKTEHSTFEEAVAAACISSL